jgi:hypothetical protein
MMSYQADIITAITMLKERNGSCIIAIKKTVQSIISMTLDKKWMNAMFLGHVEEDGNKRYSHQEQESIQARFQHQEYSFA